LISTARWWIPPRIWRPVVAVSLKKMIERGFDMQADAPGFETLRLRLLAVYRRRLAQESRVFAAMEPVLREMESRSLPWGIVTNKPAWLTDPLVKALALTERAACVISGDTAARPKPHPDSLLLAAERLGVAPETCLYVGDAERDIEAGRAAGMRTLVALFGYLDADDQPATWDADGAIEQPGDLLAWL
jgi:phosphoglycolate phosphatase